MSLSLPYPSPLNGSIDNEGALPPHNPRKDRQSTLKEKQKMQKTTEGGKASLSGFPIKDFGNGGRE